MIKKLSNYLSGRWQEGSGDGTTLIDPVTGEPLVRVDNTGLDLKAGFRFARETAGPVLRAMTYGQRAAMLSAAVKVLQTHRDAYYEIATANSGTVKNDSAVDIDGGIYTLSTYAKIGEGLGDQRYLVDGEPARLAKDPLFQSQHVLVPTHGVALFINAFNFPSWGFWEKAAPALLSGVPVIVKPATSTAWLTQRMVEDIVNAGIFPAGAISVVCGSSKGLMDALEPFDVISFTGSADTAETIRMHPAIARRSVRVNIEADSVNSALLMPDAIPGSEAFDLMIKEVAREMTQKSGQKCTAIRRAFVPRAHYAQAAEAIAARLAKTTTGNPRNETVRMGALVSRDQFNAVRDGIAQLSAHASILYDGRQTALIDADPSVACCIGPVLLGSETPASVPIVHEVEVFGPVATLMAYDSVDDALTLIRRGEGSLVASLFGADDVSLAATSIELASSHGRIHIVSPAVGSMHSGHGNAMPQSLHGGPGRAGGGEELGGARALNFYHRRSALQASSTILEKVTT